MGSAVFELVSWPAVLSIGQKPGISLETVLNLTERGSICERIVRAIVLEEDLWLHTSAIAGVEPQRSPLVLTIEMLKRKEILPEEIRIELDDSQAYADGIWSSYYNFLRELAREIKCGFLEDWAWFESTIRWGAIRRLDRVSPGEINTTLKFEDILNTQALELVEGIPLSTEPDEIWRQLEQGRMAWITEVEEWFSFELDELASYVCKLMIAERFWRVSGESTSFGKTAYSGA